MFHQQRLAAREGGQSFFVISCNCPTDVCSVCRSERRQDLYHATLTTVMIP